MRNIPVTAVTERTRAPARTSALLLLRFFVSLSVAALIAVSSVISAQRRTAFDGQMEYQLTVEKQPAQSVGAWWPAFVAQNTLEGYCWNLNTLPLADRPQLGDKAKILRVGGAGQLTQVDARDSANARTYRRLARTECLRITRQYPGTEQADAARQMLRTLDRLRESDAPECFGSDAAEC